MIWMLLFLKNGSIVGAFNIPPCINSTLPLQCKVFCLMKWQLFCFDRYQIAYDILYSAECTINRLSNDLNNYGCLQLHWIVP